ncbi:hypothetical protein [Undibacterium sp. TJN19]|uniref:hypothetical protein n=1 Tax=Undibacterium sp. TJN19 TaxID=3413055 RepID=UPI003BF2E3EA
MAKSTHTKRGTRLGTQFRGKLAVAYGQRGVGPNSLWYVYSPRMRTDWVLRSDLEWDHFVLAESDPDIVSCSYIHQQKRIVSNGQTLDIPVDVVVTYMDGSTEWRSVRFAGLVSNEQSPASVQLGQFVAAAERTGVSYRLWTEETIRNNHILLTNWRRILAWMAAARDRSLAPYQAELARVLLSDKKISLGQIETMFGEASFSLYAAAIFSELQHGVYLSDLDTDPLSTHTTIRVQGEGE